MKDFNIFDFYDCLFNLLRLPVGSPTYDKEAERAVEMLTAYLKRDKKTQGGKKWMQ